MKFGVTPHSSSFEIEEPAEVPPLRYEAIWKHLCWKWVRLAFLTLAGSSAFLAYIWFRTHVLPVPVIGVFVVGSALFSGAGLVSELLEARFRRKVWRWDHQGLTIRTRKTPWVRFQCFQVMNGSLQPDLDTFRIQFREHLLTSGIWIEITAYRAEIEALATISAQHVVDKSKQRHDASWLTKPKAL